MNYQALIGILLYMFAAAICIVALIQPICTLTGKAPSGVTVSADYYATKICVNASMDNISESKCTTSTNSTEKALMGGYITMLTLSALWIIACATGLHRVKQILGVLLFLDAIFIIITITTISPDTSSVSNLLMPSTVKLNSYTIPSILALVASGLVIIHEILAIPFINRRLFKHTA
jgi:hypothetical protein